MEIQERINEIDKEIAAINGKMDHHNWQKYKSHHVHMLVLDHEDKKIEVDELQHRTFTFRTEVNTTVRKGRSLAANVVHSVDAYIAREVVRRCHKECVQVATIHDSFWTYPGDMNVVRRHFIGVLTEIADSNLLQDILKQITGETDFEIDKDSDDLADDIRQSEYALS